MRIQSMASRLRITASVREARTIRELIETHPLEPMNFKPAVTTNSGGRRAVIAFDANGRIRGKQGRADDMRLRSRPIEEMAGDQGCPDGWISRMKEHGAFTAQALKIGVGNGVPLPMGRALARAVKRAIQRPADVCTCQSFPTHCANDCPQHGEEDVVA